MLFLPKLILFSTELSNETIGQRDYLIQQLGKQLDESRANNIQLEEEKHRLATDLDVARGKLETFEQKITELTAKLATSEEEKAAEIEANRILQVKIDKLEASLKSDKKYKELKEKITNLEKEVDSLNVVIEMKNQRVRTLESEKMQTEVELQAYERLRETHQKLLHEKEALTETVALKARKNAEQSRELDGLRGELRRELTARKQLATKADQLEYQLNESREQLSFFENTFDTSQFFTPCERNPQRSGLGSLSIGINTGNTRPRTARRLFSTPAINSLVIAEASSSSNSSSNNVNTSRQHYQHQEPVGGNVPMHEAMLKMQNDASAVIDHVSSSSSSTIAMTKGISPIAKDHHNVNNLNKYVDNFGHDDQDEENDQDKSVTRNDQLNIDIDN